MLPSTAPAATKSSGANSRRLRVHLENFWPLPGTVSVQWAFVGLDLRPRQSGGWQMTIRELPPPSAWPVISAAREGEAWASQSIGGHLRVVEGTTGGSIAATLLWLPGVST